MTKPAEIVEERVSIPSGDERLEGVLSYPMESEGPGKVGPQAICFLAPPHPFMGGTLENNVLRCLAQELAQAGHVALRFNYRGVGDSSGASVDVLAGMQQFWESGNAPHDPLLLVDAAAAKAWLLEQANPAGKVSRPPLVAIGYSFGAYAAVSCGLEDVDALIMILPTVRQHDFSVVTKSCVPKLVLYSDDDFATPKTDVERWIVTLPNVRRAVCVPQGQHFFRGLETHVAKICLAFLDKSVREVENAA